MGGFFCDANNLSLIEDFGKRFKAICEDTERFTPIVSQGIKKAEAQQAEQERLMRTVRGQLMQNPSAHFDMMTPDGNIRLMDGKTQFIKIGGVTYAAYELLDQEVSQIRRRTCLTKASSG